MLYGHQVTNAPLLFKQLCYIFGIDFQMYPQVKCIKAQYVLYTIWNEILVLIKFSLFPQVKVIHFLLYNNLPLTVHQLCHSHFYRCTPETHNELFTVYYWIWKPQTNPGFEANTNLILVLAFSKLISCVTLLSHLLIPVHIFPTCKKHVCLMYIKKHAWSIEMAQWVKLLAYKPDNLSLIPKGIRTNSTKLSSDLIHTPLNHLKFKTLIAGIGAVSFLPLTVL